MTVADAEVRVDAVDAVVRADRILRDRGASAKHAALQARMLVEADLRGRPSHGLQRLPTLVTRMDRGLVSGSVEPDLEWVSDAFLAVDGRHGFGVVAAHAAIKTLAERTERTVVAVAAIRDSSHLGMLAPYLEEMGERGLASVILTTSEALVHPAGGRIALIGTNPIGIGIPGADAGSFVLDMSTAAISAGEIIAHQHRGSALPVGRAVDADGRATTDPARALEGAISPFGGAKGYGLGLGIELLVPLLTGTAVGRAVLGTLDVRHPATKGDLIVAFDPVAAGQAETLPILARYLEELRATPTAPGVERVLVPGDRMRMCRAERVAGGIPYPVALWAALADLEESHD